LRTFGSRAVPALPGATSTSLASGERDAFHAIACSRPPPPITSTFIFDVAALNAGSAACP
jgi:hypothetical protein